MGWETDHSRPGPTYGARTMFGHRVLANGIWIFKEVRYPGIFDAIAWPEQKHEIEETFKVYTSFRGSTSRPEIPATLFLKNFDGEEEWWAHFPTELEAVMFVRSLPQGIKTTLKSIYQEES